jgi:hypothetical protein
MWGSTDNMWQFFETWMWQLRRRAEIEEERAMALMNQAVERCGFQTSSRKSSSEAICVGNREILGPTGEPLTADEQVTLKAALDAVTTEYQEQLRAQAAAAAEARRKVEEAKKAAAEAAAAPYREERRRRKAEAFAKRNPNRTT